MKTSRLSQWDVIEPAPDWWAEIWPLRQVELRQKIRQISADAPKIGYTAAAYEISARHFDRREVIAALTALVADGQLVCEGGRYRVLTGNDVVVGGRTS